MKTIKAAILCFIICSVTSVSAQTADELADKYVKAIGGREKLNAVKSIKLYMKMHVQGLDIPMITYMRKPGSLRMETTFQGIMAVTVYDDKTKTGWNLNPIEGDTVAQKMNPEQTTEMETSAEETVASALVNYKATGGTLELIGKEDLEGVETYKLMLTKKNKTIIYYSLDASTFLILKETTKTKFQDKEIESETFYSNCKPFNGIMVPCTTEVKEGGQLQVQIAVEKVEMDVAMEDALFSKPSIPAKNDKKEAPKKSGGN